MEIEPTTVVQPVSRTNTEHGAPIEDSSEPKEATKENSAENDGTNPAARNFDLNADVDETNDAKAMATTSSAAAVVGTATTPVATASVETKTEEYPGWSLSEMERIDPLQLAHLSKRIDEDEEDYDEEG